MESTLTNTLSPDDRVVSFQIGQLSLLWIDQQQHLRFNVDAVESEWVQGANLDVLASKLPSACYHSMSVFASIVQSSHCVAIHLDALSPVPMNWKRKKK
jgi:alanine-glyoxylate transaminase / serine-glyoxylate transaminase / serine-pyruvate transaminase